MNRRGASGMEDDKGGVAAAWEEDTAGELQEKRKKNKEEVVLPEDAYADVEVPPWWAQITLRGMFVSAILSLVFSIIVIKLSLATGVIPSLNISAGLLSFFLIKLWTSFLSRFGLLQTPFTRQENTVIQTCVVASSGLAFSGGFGSYIPGMDSITYKLATDATTTPGDDSLEVKNPSLGWIFGFMFAVSFLGLLAVVPLRKIMIIDYKLTYPSGTATAVLINSFHTPTGAKQAKFYFDFSLLYVGTGMICPHLVNCSMLFGGIISWGLMWPLINNNKGKWFSADLPASSLKSINGYRVFIAIALILGDGLYNFVKIVSVTLRSLYLQHQKNQELPTNREKEGIDELSPSEQRRNTVFMKDSIPFKLAAIGYVALAAVSVVTIPRIFPQMRWYYVFISYCIAPVLGFCNAYGCGLTDWSLASTYGKLGLFIFSAWAGSGGGGVIVGLVSCGVMMVIVSCSADLMQDFKTGYLTLSSPRSMFASQILGTLMGCIIAPLSFWLFWTAFPIGDQNGTYPAPYALVYREMAAIGVEGFSALPEHCLDLCYGFFAFAIVTCLTRDLVPEKVSMFIPIPMAMAIPFYLGVYFVIDMFIGTVVVFVWQRVNRKKANVFIPAVASGLICGDGIWTLPAAILALAKVYPPICMLFASRSQASKLLSQLGG